MMVNPKGWKNSAGGAEPERSSPMAGARSSRASHGGTPNPMITERLLRL
jgi:hypothetical protein